MVRATRVTRLAIAAAAVFALAPMAHALYSTVFPQIADGGSAAQKWITTLTFANPRAFATVYTVYIRDDNGNPLAIDFGSGPQSQFEVAVPRLGTATYRSTAASSQTVTGWVLVESPNVIVANVLYEFTVNGVPQQGVTVAGSAPATVWYSFATAQTGVAVANTNTFAIQINLALIDQSGNILYSLMPTFAEGEHWSFTVAHIWPVSPNFRGSVLAWTPSQDNFVATAISGDGGVLSSYPVIEAPNLDNIIIGQQLPR